MRKLQDLQINEYILKWIYNYLTDRKQQVVVEGAKSDLLSVTSGIPQGSVLGPLLFIIDIDGVDTVTLSDGTVITYADDMVLYRPIYSQNDYRLLQRDIEAVARWVSNLHLQFNANKCKYMIMSRKRTHLEPPVLLLNGTALKLKGCSNLSILASTSLPTSPGLLTSVKLVRRQGNW